MVGRKRVAADGSVSFRKGERIDLAHQVAKRHVGDTMPVQVYRDGEVKEFELSLKSPRFLVAEDAYDVKPTYYLYGGLLFVPLSRDLLKTWGSEWWQEAPPEIVAIYENEIRSASRSEIVILQKVLADRGNQGYHDVEMLVIERVQGRTDPRPRSTDSHRRVSNRRVRTLRGFGRTNDRARA